MPYSKAKVYSNGSHYIAIPHTGRPYRKRGIVPIFFRKVFSFVTIFFKAEECVTDFYF